MSGSAVAVHRGGDALPWTPRRFLWAQGLGLSLGYDRAGRGEAAWVVKDGALVEAGLSGEIIAAIAEGRRPSRMAADEEVLYTLHDELHRTHAVSDATYAKAVAAFGEQGVVDALGITGYYTLLAMVMNTARTPMPPGATAALAPLRK